MLWVGLLPSVHPCLFFWSNIRSFLSLSQSAQRPQRRTMVFFPALPEKKKNTSVNAVGSVRDIILCDLII